MAYQPVLMYEGEVMEALDNVPIPVSRSSSYVDSVEFYYHDRSSLFLNARMFSIGNKFAIGLVWDDEVIESYPFAIESIEDKMSEMSFSMPYYKYIKGVSDIRERLFLENLPVSSMSELNYCGLEFVSDIDFLHGTVLMEPKKLDVNESRYYLVYKVV